MAFYFAGEITQVLDAIPWVRCASGNVGTNKNLNPKPPYALRNLGGGRVGWEGGGGLISHTKLASIIYVNETYCSSTSATQKCKKMAPVTP